MKEITLVITEKDFITIRKALGHEPYDDVNELIYKLSLQVKEQAEKKE